MWEVCTKPRRQYAARIATKQLPCNEDSKYRVPSTTYSVPRTTHQAPPEKHSSIANDQPTARISPCPLPARPTPRRRVHFPVSLPARSGLPRMTPDQGSRANYAPLWKDALRPAPDSDATRSYDVELRLVTKIRKTAVLFTRAVAAVEQNAVLFVLPTERFSSHRVDRFRR